MKRKLLFNFFIPLLVIIMISPISLSLIEHNYYDKSNEFYSIYNSHFNYFIFELYNQENISFDMQVRDPDGIWHDYNITAFNNSYIEFNVELKTTRGYQLLAAALSLPNTDKGSLLYIFNNSFECSKKPTIMDISNSEIVLLWLPVLLPTIINFNFMAKIQNLGVEKEALGAIVGSIDNDSFDIVNDSFYITSIPSPIPDIPNQPEGPTTGLPDNIYNYSTNTRDPDGDQVYYKWDWGDQIISDWEGPFNSGEIVNSSHLWSSRGYYNIRVKARDVDWHESEWSDPLVVKMPKTKSINNFNPWISKLIEKFLILESLL